MLEQPLETMDARALGSRLRMEREARGLTQQDVADHLKVARTTVVSIEKGGRRLKEGELLSLARLYGSPVSDLLQRGAPEEGFVVQLRSSGLRSRGSKELAAAILSFQSLCEDYVRLEEICDAPLRPREAHTYRIAGIEPELAGEDAAVTERQRLGLGDGPLPAFRELLEREFGLRVFFLDLPSAVAGMFVFTQGTGGCIAVNRKHPPERRCQTMAHELAHFLVEGRRAEITETEGYHRRPAVERFTESFARAFAMPAAGLRRRFLDLARGRSSGLTHGDLCRLAHYYGVSAEGMTRRLEELSVLPSGTWERLRQRGSKVREAQRLLGLELDEGDAEILPRRFVALAVEAWQRGQLSEGQLARLLRTDRLGARQQIELLDGSGHEEEEALDLAAPLVEAH